MNARDVFTSKAIAVAHTEAQTNATPYLGEAMFPRQKQAGIDLKWLRTHKGLAVSLMPSAYDTKSAIRQREGAKLLESEMAYFKESMIISERDEQEIARISNLDDPYAKDVFASVFDDAETLVRGADVVPERMRMQLLAPTDGHPHITIAADGATYDYQYDADNNFHTNNFVEVDGAKAWTDAAAATPIADLQATIDANPSDSTLAYALMSKNTFSNMMKCQEVRTYLLAQNSSANVLVTEGTVKALVKGLLGIDIVVYKKKFVDEAGNQQNFFPDGMVSLIPEGQLGKTYYGTTPDERTAANNDEADVSLVGEGVAIAVSTLHDPDQTKTTVSEVVLPSFERMNECMLIKAY